MRRVFFIAALAALTASFLGCASKSSDSAPANAAVQAYVAAVPNTMMLSPLIVPATPRTAGRKTALAGENATFPPIAVPIAVSINSITKILVDSLQFAVSQPYAYHDAVNGEVYWGPFDYDGGSGKLVLTVMKEEKSAPTDPDAYFWILIRVPDNFDLMAAIAANVPPPNTYPIFAGYTEPDTPDGYFGVAMVDMDAEADAGTAYGDAGPFGSGVFVTAFGEYKDQSDPDFTYDYVLSVFNNFGFNGTDPAINADYLYGDIFDQTTDITFFNFVTSSDFIEDTTAKEDMDIRLAFLNKKDGRAEVEMSGGDVTGLGSATECWDNTFITQFMEFSDGVDTATSPLGGDSTLCTTPFEDDLTTIGIPTTSDANYSPVFDLLNSMASGGIYAFTGWTL